MLLVLFTFPRRCLTICKMNQDNSIQSSVLQMFFFSRKPQLLTPLSQVKNSTFFNPPLILWINIMILLRLAKFNWHVLVSVALKKVSEFLFRLKASSLSCAMLHQQYLLCLKSIELWSSGTFHQTKLFFAIFLTKNNLLLT